MKTKTKLNWKKKWLNDESGYWYSAKVPIIGWEYNVDHCESDDKFSCYVFYSEFGDDDIYITNRTYKTKEKAFEICEKHLEKTLEKFKRLIEQK